MCEACGVTAPLTPSIQCSTGPFWAWDLADALDTIAAAGYREVEMMVTRDPQTHDPDIPLKLATDRGLRIASVHGPFLVVTKTVWGSNAVVKIRRGIEMCRAFGADTLIVHPPYLWEQQFAHWVRNEAALSAAESGVVVAVETMFPKWVAGRQMRLHRWLDPRELFRECPHVALDTSHVTVARHDAIEAFEVLLPKLVHIHLSNNNGDGKDGHLELGQGILPMERIIGRIGHSQYAGAISLELNVNAYLERKDALVGMLRRNREFIEQHLQKPKATKGLPRTS
jgi:sugar phosphate isomerase/epimerase